MWVFIVTFNHADNDCGGKYHKRGLRTFPDDWLWTEFPCMVKDAAAVKFYRFVVEIKRRLSSKSPIRSMLPVPCVFITAFWGQENVYTCVT